MTVSRKQGQISKSHVDLDAQSVCSFQQIQGEVYEIDTVKLQILDNLEAYPTLYWRQEEKVRDSKEMDE